MSTFLCVITLNLLLFYGECSLRLKIDGSSLIDPITNKEIMLKGLNWYLPYIEPNDTDTMKSLIPSVNIVRLQGIYWDNNLNANLDCRTNNASHGYIKQSCIEQLLSAVSIITKYNSATNKNNIWVILTGRGEYAAGQDYPTYPDVFHNATLRNEYYAMWKYVATIFRSIDYIGGYEIMAEPRSKIVNQSVVQSFYQGACDIVHASDVDPYTPCIVGPTPYYKPWMLNDTLLIHNNSNNVIYTVDFFIPVNYIKSGVEGNQYNYLTYPGIYECNVALPGWTCAATHHVPPCFCPDNYKENITVNKQWLINLLTQYPLAFRDNYNVPLWINQWGIYYDVDVNRGKLTYTQDIVDIFKDYKIHSTSWVWKWQQKNYPYWHAYEWIHNCTNNDTLIIDYPKINIVNNTWNNWFV